MSISSSVKALASALFLTCAITAHAQNQSNAENAVVLKGSSAQITLNDLDSDTQKAPAETRKNMLSNPEIISRLASNLYVRRALANEAEQRGLSKEPKVAAALQLARDRILSDAAVTEMDANLKPDEKALDAYAAATYKTQPVRFKKPEELRARHILLDKTGTDAKVKADELLSKLKSGADFNEQAALLSIDKANASKGGDLGFFGRDKMVKPFSDAAFALKAKGDLSEVVESQFGYHIIMLEERNPEGVRPFEEVREALRQEAIAKLKNDLRLAQEQRLLKDVVYEREAIDAYATKNK